MLGRGAWRAFRALHLGSKNTDSLRFAATGVALLLLAPLGYLFSDAMAIGDPSVANIGVAVATSLLPVSLGASFVTSWRGSAPGRRIDLALLLLSGQWCAVLAANGFLPLTLWR